MGELQNEPVVDNRYPDSECAGGKSFADCDAASRLLEATRDFEPDRHLWALDGVRHFNHIAFVEVGCVACKNICKIAIEMHERLPTGNARVFYETTGGD